MIDERPERGFLTLGQPAARRVTTHAAQRGELGRSLLVHGPRGAGKDAFVDDLLALLLCADPDPSVRPCNACRGCRDARRRTHPDLVVGSPDRWREARTSGESIVAAARRWLLEAAGAPVVAGRRVVLIEHADRANEQTQNALLKALEEPGDRHTFILVADEPQRLLPTIRSRCRPLRIGPVRRDELVSLLMDRMRLPRDQADTLAHLSGGLVGTAVRFVEQAALLDWRRRTQLELLELLQRSRADRFAAVRDLLDEAVKVAAPAPLTDAEGTDADAPRSAPPSRQREAALLLVEAWLALTRDLLVASAGRAELAPSHELAPELERLAPRLQPRELTQVAQRLERVREALEQNGAPRLALETAMLLWPSPAAEASHRSASG